MSDSKNSFGRKPITPKTKKLHPRVDLTAMVSVSFLLIVFFMLTSFLSRSNMMNLGMPEKRTRCGWSCPGTSDNRSITILLGDNNKIMTYFGMFSSPVEGPKSLTYDKNSLRKELLTKGNQIINATGDPKKGLIVIVKPSKHSTYKNLVDVLDELTITKVPTYAVVDITPEEEKLFTKF